MKVKAVIAGAPEELRYSAAKPATGRMSSLVVDGLIGKQFSVLSKYLVYIVYV